MAQLFARNGAWFLVSRTPSEAQQSLISTVIDALYTQVSW
jgi:hypothetical protein